jgi:hypothetical protein
MRFAWHPTFARREIRRAPHSCRSHSDRDDQFEINQQAHREASVAQKTEGSLKKTLDSDIGGILPRFSIP